MAEDSAYPPRDPKTVRWITVRHLGESSGGNDSHLRPQVYGWFTAGWFSDGQSRSSPNMRCASQYPSAAKAIMMAAPRIMAAECNPKNMPPPGESPSQYRQTVQGDKGRERTFETATDKLLMSVTAFADELEREKARQRTYDATWRTLIRQNVMEARPVLETLLAGRIAVTPRRDTPTKAATFDVRIPLTMSGLFEGICGPNGVASPGGFDESCNLKFQGFAA